MTIQESFLKIFDPCLTTTGVTSYKREKKKKGGKVKSTSITEKRQPTIRDIENHFDGTISLGLSPLKQDDTCLWGAIDIDHYPLDVERLSKKWAAYPVFPCRTKSGGIHLYVFFLNPIPAKEVQLFLNQLANLLQLYSLVTNRSKIEVFPKQVKSDTVDNPNWINLPYYDASNTDRYCVKNGVRLTLEQFINSVELSKISKFRDVLENFIMYESPPCLMNMWSSSVQQGNRDRFLLNAGVFLKMKHVDTWEGKLFELNLLLDEPIDDKELHQTIVSQLLKKDIFYQCRTELKEFCKKSHCLTLRFGIGKENSPERILGKLLKILSVPPVWKIQVNNVDVEVTTEELLNQDKFRKRCLEEVNIIPPRIKQAEWDDVLGEKLRNIELVEAPEDADIDAELRYYVMRFCVERSNARNFNDLNLQKVYLVNGRNFFLSASLKEYLRRKSLARYDQQQLYNRLRTLDLQSDRVYIEGKQRRVWTLPVFDEQTQKDEQKKDVPVWDEFEKEEF